MNQYNRIREHNMQKTQIALTIFGSNTSLLGQCQASLDATFSEYYFCIKLYSLKKQ